MGSGSSSAAKRKDVPGEASRSKEKAYFEAAFSEAVIESGILKRDEIQERLTTLSTRKVRLGESRSCSFAALMLRGVYPDELERPCQDSFVASEALTSDNAANERVHWLQVFDGHGCHGHEVAEFCRDSMPQIAVEFKACEPKATPEELLKAVHLSVDAELRSNDGVPTRESGTTAVSLMTVGDTLYCANVGDSRCVLGVLADGAVVKDDKDLEDAKKKKKETKKTGGRMECCAGEKQGTSESLVVPKCLSKDQTFYRADERERCVAAGGRIMTLTQAEGGDATVQTGDVACCDLGAEIDTEGDPPRLFLPGEKDPGCAFSRSIGDDIAKQIGCSAEPEIMSHDLGDDDLLAVIATDGIWELLTNQQVLDMCVDAADPLEACYRAVAEAYQRWNKAEGRVDDTCIIVCFFDGTKQHKKRLKAAQEHKKKNTRRDNIATPILDKATAAAPKETTP